MIKITEDFYKNSEISSRKLLGQYMTPSSLRDELWNVLSRFIDLKSVKNALEPSAGTGEFLNDMRSRLLITSVKEYYEKDAILYKQLSEEFSDKEGFRIIGDDYLLTSNKDRYDLIVGNPPYFEMNDDKLKRMYPYASSGRQNISAIFVAKAFEELKENGIFAFVLPSSLNSGSYFKDLRKELISNGEILFLKKYKSNFFKGAQQSVTIIIFRKNMSVKSSAFVLNIGNKIIFTENPDLYKQYSLNKDSFKSLGMKSTTGTFVWNQRKNELRNVEEDSSTLIIWSHNISTNGSIVLSNKKPQYANTQLAPLKGPAIVFNRVVGSVGAGKIKCAYIAKGVSFIAENHVNVVLSKKISEVEFQNIFNKIKQRDHLIALSTLGNTQLSARELEELITF